MLFGDWLDVPDAMAFLDAFAEAAEKTRGWKLDHIKTDFGHQFVYVRYTGRKFTGIGLRASAFAPLQPRTGRRFVAGSASPIPCFHSSHDSHKSHPGFAIHSLQRVNLTLCADRWPDHICFDEIAKSLLAPLLKKANRPAHALRLVK